MRRGTAAARPARDAWRAAISAPTTVMGTAALFGGTALAAWLMNPNALFDENSGVEFWQQAVLAGAILACVLHGFRERSPRGRALLAGIAVLAVVFFVRETPNCAADDLQWCAASETKRLLIGLALLVLLAFSLRLVILAVRETLPLFASLVWLPVLGVGAMAVVSRVAEVNHLVALEELAELLASCLLLAAALGIALRPSR